MPLVWKASVGDEGRDDTADVVVVWSNSTAGGILRRSWTWTTIYHVDSHSL